MSLGIEGKWQYSRRTRSYAFRDETDEESQRPATWCFWRHLSCAGQFTIHDCSCYGHVLVEHVEEYASEQEWMAVVNNFGEQLYRHGLTLAKFWLHISVDEQLRRFRAREKMARKRY